MRFEVYVLQDLKRRLLNVHRVEPNWWYVVCEDCGYTTETKLFLRRAVKCWNKHSRDHIFSDSDIDFSDY